MSNSQLKQLDEAKTSGLISQTSIVEQLWISVPRQLNLLMRNSKGVNDIYLLNCHKN